MRLEVRHLGNMRLEDRHLGKLRLEDRHLGKLRLEVRHLGKMRLEDKHLGKLRLEDNIRTKAAELRIICLISRQKITVSLSKICCFSVEVQVKVHSFT